MANSTRDMEGFMRKLGRRNAGRRAGHGRGSWRAGLPAAVGLAITMSAAATVEGQEVHRISGTDVAVYNLAGHVQVIPGSGSDVVVRVNRGGRDASRLEVETGPIGGRGTLRVIYPSDEIVYPEMGRGSNTNLTVRPDGTFSDGGRRDGDRVNVRGSGDGLEAWADLVVEVPSGRNMEVYLAVGRADARGVRGDLRVDTGSGSVTVSDVTGALVVDTGSGSVEVRDVRGDVLVDTGSGRVDAARIVGDDVEFDTGSGRIQVDGVEARRLRVDTGSGGIRVTGVRSPDVEIDTGSGGIEVELLADIERFVVDTGSGSVTVRVPDGFGAEVELDTGSGRIEVELPMEVRSVRRDHVSGRIGDGGGRLSVDTGSGGIEILRGG
jgi:lia operon protein LiaG